MMVLMNMKDAYLMITTFVENVVTAKVQNMNI